MDLYPATLPKICLLGTFAHTREALTWLQEVSRPEVVNHSDFLEREMPLAEVQLVLLDAEGPQAESVCRQLKQSLALQHIPVLVLFQGELTERGQLLLESGATDFLRASTPRAAFMARIRTHLTSQTIRVFTQTRAALLKSALIQQRLDTSAARDSAMDILSTLIEAREPGLRPAQLRRQAYLHALAKRARGDHPKFHLLTDDAVASLCKSAPLQELGRLSSQAAGMATAFLGDHGPHMSHSIRGLQLLDDFELRHGQPIGFLGVAREMIHSRHERWDGSGLPLGLRGEQIPLSARLMALVNLYEEIVGGRISNHEGLHEQACDRIFASHSGALDPDLVSAFIDSAEEFRRIALRHADRPHSAHAPVRELATSPQQAIASSAAQDPAGEPTVLRELDERVARLPDQVALFVVALLANSTLLSRTLSDYIVLLLVRRVPLNLGPMHLTFTKMVNAQIEKSEAALANYQDHLAMLRACGSGETAVQALNFIVELAGLQHQPTIDSAQQPSQGVRSRDRR